MIGAHQVSNRQVAGGGRSRHQVNVPQERKIDFVTAKEGRGLAMRHSIISIIAAAVRIHVAAMACRVKRPRYLWPADECVRGRPHCIDPLAKAILDGPTIGALVILCTGLASATEHKVASVPKLDVPFNAKWDRCELLARQRGVPPGKIGYGAFIENCMGKVSPNPSQVTARAAESRALEHPGARRQ